MPPIRLFLATAILCSATVIAPAHAAHSYDNCTGTITSLPAVISTQGTWCLKSNLATSMAYVSAVTIAANNVTIDCNDYKIGGLAAGPGTWSTGVQVADGVQNPTVRNCGVRGFQVGIVFAGGTNGGVVEDSRIDGSTVLGLDIKGSGHVVRRNRIVDTGGAPGGTQSAGMLIWADETSVTDNQVAGVAVDDDDGDAIGIFLTGTAIELARNYVTGVVPGDGAEARGVGIRANTANFSVIRDNHLLNASFNIFGYGIDASGTSFCSGNRIVNYDSGIVGCLDAGGNSTY